MKYCYRILSKCRNLANIASQPQIRTHLVSGNLSNIEHNRKIHSYPIQLFGFRGDIYQTQKKSCSNPPIYGQSRFFSRVGLGRNGFLVGFDPPDVRNCSTSVDHRVNESNFESVYLKGGVHVKPFVEKTATIDEHLIEEKGEVIDKIDEGEKKGDFRVESRKREESEIEKEAWRLLRNAVVTYCNSPVGTVAANDPNDKTPLNYDQVFLRDFIPSALAFLMKGEGEIVKNFLLHTLHLQVILILILN